MPAPEPEQHRTPVLQRADTLAGAATLLFLASVIALIVGAHIAGALLAALAVTLSTLVVLAVRVERDHLIHKLQRAEAEASEARQSKTRLLSIASHDMRQPLHALTLYLGALRKRVEGAEAQGILDKMDRAANALTDMFGSVVEFGRMDGAIEPVLETFAVQDLIEAAVAQHPEITIAATAPNARIRSDRALLTQALDHLIGNALRHGGGAARIETREDEDLVEIVVIDQGAGIAVEDQARIFGPFERGESGARGEGLGLGLAIVTRIAAALGAELNVQSAPGQGARFSLRLPLAS